MRIITVGRTTAMTKDIDVATNADATLTTTHRTDTIGLRLGARDRGTVPTCGAVLAATFRTGHFDWGRTLAGGSAIRIGTPHRANQTDQLGKRSFLFHPTRA